jgi:hypothetical protein
MSSLMFFGVTPLFMAAVKKPMTSESVLALFDKSTSEFENDTTEVLFDPTSPRAAVMQCGASRGHS